MADYSFVIDNTFQPFSMQEMLVPFSAYKDAFEKTEETYNELTDKADAFKYLSKTLPKGSKARDIYEGYANDLKTQADDLGSYGLTMGNRRALSSLRRRYTGEIGRLVKADEALKEEKALRKQLNAQDSSRLYALDNLSIDDFLDGGNPNLYSVSGKELYTRGANIGKAYSSRVFNVGDKGSTLAGMYRDFVSANGYSPELINAFRNDMSKIPELRDAADALLVELGVNQNLTGINLERARKSVINGIIDNAIYTENHNPVRDVSVPSWTEKVQADQGQQSINLQKDKFNFKKQQYKDNLAINGITRNKDGSLSYDETKVLGSGSTKTSKSTRNTNTNTILSSPVAIGASTGKAYNIEDIKDSATYLSSSDRTALVNKYGDIANDRLKNTIEGGDLSDYEIQIVKNGTLLEKNYFSPDTKAEEDIYILTPKNHYNDTQSVKSTTPTRSTGGTGGTNDEPH